LKDELLIHFQWLVKRKFKGGGRPRLLVAGPGIVFVTLQWNSIPFVSKNKN